MTMKKLNRVLLSVLLSIILSSIGGLDLKAQPCGFPVAGFDCESAPVLCDIADLDGYCTSLPDFVNATGPSPLCNGAGVPNNTIWFGFVAGSTFFNVNIIPANCTNAGGQFGIQGGIYGGPCQNLYSIACQGTCTTAPLNLQSSNFIPGQVYWFIIDGCNGSVCDITVDIIAGAGNVPGTINNITGPNKVCSSDSITYNYYINDVLNVDYYYWTLNGVLLGDPLFEDQNIEVNFPKTGKFKLCVDVANYCVTEDQPPAAKCIDITVSASKSSTLPTVQICARDTFIYKGKPYTVGKHEIKYPIANQCDSIVFLTVDSFPVPITDIGTYYICNKECVTIKDQYGDTIDVCESAKDKKVYLQNWMGCDSIINVNVKKIGLNQKLKTSGTINCINSTVDISSNIAPENVLNYSIAWSTVDGQIIGSTVGENIKVNEPGTYCANISMNGSNGITCLDTSCINVVIDTSVQQAGYYFDSDSVITCTNNHVLVWATSNTPDFNSNWIYNSNISIGDSLFVDQPGIITLIVVGNNGCGNDTLKFNVEADFKVKQQVEYDTLLCYGEEIIIDSVSHKAPDDFTVNSQSNDTCFSIRYLLELMNQGDTVLYQCDNDPIIFFDQVIPNISVQTIAVENTTSCDSVWHVQIIKKSSFNKNQIVQVNKGGFYHGIKINKDTVIVENFISQYGCDSIITTEVKLLVAVNDLNKDLKIKLVPNPAKDLITVSCENELYTTEIAIVNNLGQKIYSKKNREKLPLNIDVSTFPEGIYWIRILTEKGVYPVSFIKIK